jgi:chromosome segregation ATPase
VLIGVVIVMLATTGSTVYLGIQQQHAIAANRALTARLQELERIRDEQERTARALAAEHAKSLAELDTLRQTGASDATTIDQLREQVSLLESRAATLQDEIKKAQAEGTLKETRLADLRVQLDETRASAQTAQSQLRAMGYTKDELNDQVSKLQARLAASQSDLEAAQHAADEQKRAIADLNTALTDSRARLGTANDQVVTLERANQGLSAELASRPKPSPFGPERTYRPSSDRIARAGAK